MKQYFIIESSEKLTAERLGELLSTDDYVKVTDITDKIIGDEELSEKDDE